MRSGFVIAAPTPYGSGKLRVEEVQLAKPASIVALGMLIERTSRIAKDLGLEGPARDPGADNRRWNCPSLHLCNQLVNVESLAGMRQQIGYVSQPLDVFHAEGCPPAGYRPEVAFTFEHRVLIDALAARGRPSRLDAQTRRRWAFVLGAFYLALASAFTLISLDGTSQKAQCGLSIARAFPDAPQEIGPPNHEEHRENKWKSDEYGEAFSRRRSRWRKLLIFPGIFGLGLHLGREYLKEPASSPLSRIQFASCLYGCGKNRGCRRSYLRRDAASVGLAVSLVALTEVGPQIPS
jgi:hypothetical protein